MTPEDLITAVESGLCRVIRWALLWRHPEAVDLAALAALPVAALQQWALVYVQSESRLYEWDADSQAAPILPAVIQSSTLAPTAFGRWVRIDSSLTYGAGGVALAQKRDGFLRVVESYESDDGPDATIERCLGFLPSVMVQFQGDDPKSKDNTPGSFYLNTLRFRLFLLSSNLRGEPSATQGSRFAAEAADDPGIYKIAGCLRRVIGGVSFCSGVAGVERYELGPLDLAFEDVDRRIQVWTMGITAKTSFEIVDEDLLPLAIRAQPALTECWPLQRWDRANYIGSGGGLDSGAGVGLTRTIDATLGMVRGQSVSAAALPIVFAASRDTYRYLRQSGDWYFVVREIDAAAPAADSDALLVGCTRTDASGVVFDRALCSFTIALPPPIDVPS